MRQLLITLLAALLYALPALATNDIWVTTPAGTRACKLEKDKVCFYDTATTAATAVMPSRQCREFTASFVSDITDNALTANTAQVFRFFGTGLTALTGDDEAIATEGAILNGDGAAGTDALYGMDAPAVYFSVTNSSGTSRAILHCTE